MILRHILLVHTFYGIIYSRLPPDHFCGRFWPPRAFKRLIFAADFDRRVLLKANFCPFKYMRIV